MSEKLKQSAIDALCSLEISRDNGGNVGVSCGAYPRLPRDRAQGIVQAISAGLIPSLGVLPRWIPVAEGLPDVWQKVDLLRNGARFIDMHFYEGCGGYFTSIDGSTSFWLQDKENGNMCWIPIMKGPMG